MKPLPTIPADASPRLRRVLVADFLESLPPRAFSLAHYYCELSHLGEHDIGCIAGWTCYLFQPELAKTGIGMSALGTEAARDILGLSSEQARMFYDYNWDYAPTAREAAAWLRSIE